MLTALIGFARVLVAGIVMLALLGAVSCSSLSADELPSIDSVTDRIEQKKSRLPPLPSESAAAEVSPSIPSEVSEGSQETGATVVPTTAAEVKEDIQDRAKTEQAEMQKTLENEKVEIQEKLKAANEEASEALNAELERASQAFDEEISRAKTKLEPALEEEAAEAGAATSEISETVEEAGPGS